MRFMSCHLLTVSLKLSPVICRRSSILNFCFPGVPCYWQWKQNVRKLEFFSKIQKEALHIAQWKQQLNFEINLCIRYSLDNWDMDGQTTDKFRRCKSYKLPISWLANHRVKHSDPMWGPFDIFSVQGLFGVIQCSCLKMAYNSKTTGDRVETDWNLGLDSSFLNIFIT